MRPEGKLKLKMQEQEITVEDALTAANDLRIEKAVRKHIDRVWDYYWNRCWKLEERIEQLEASRPKE